MKANPFPHTNPSLQVLLLDEPSSGCDAHTRELIRQDILSRKRSCAVLLSTHHVDDVEVLVSLLVMQVDWDQGG